jgi:hypothetical protein
MALGAGAGKPILDYRNLDMEHENEDMEHGNEIFPLALIDLGFSF